MPIFLDRHLFEGLTAADIAEAHRRDLDIQHQFGVRFITYWFDDVRGTAFCLIDAPDAETAMRVHSASHGNVAAELIEVDLSAIEAFLGRVTDCNPASQGTDGVSPALRAVMFTDIVDSTGLTTRLGDARMVEMIRAHDSLVRRALGESGGREVKHTGDGIMASFEEVRSAVECACAIQRSFEAFNLESREKLNVRIGLDVGEPVADCNDLFGATVQMAARLCEAAEPNTVLISPNVRVLLDDGFDVKERRSRRMKGFAASVTAFEVAGFRDTLSSNPYISASGFPELGSAGKATDSSAATAAALDTRARISLAS